MIRDDHLRSSMTVIATSLICSFLSACGGGAGSETLASDASTIAAVATAAGAAPVAEVAVAGPAASAAASIAVDAAAPRQARSATLSISAPMVVATTPSVTTSADLQASNAAAWPFVQPPLDALRASSKKVFAHYFTPFPISIDNQTPSLDYYSVNYLQASGENNKFIGSGGFIKQRPLPRPVISGSDWFLTDVAQDVRRAAALGIDGFAVDLLATSGTHWTRALQMLDTATVIDPGFKILLMPDMEAELKSAPQNLLPALRTLVRHAAAYRLADGRVVLAPYNAQNQSAVWWQQVIATLSAEGTPVAFFPVFQGFSKYAAAYAPLSVGMSDWGDRSPGANAGWVNAPAQAHAYKTLWMSPVAPQDARAKDLLYTEARNSENYRLMWANAIQGGADWVQIITWNDYSESTEISPSSGTQWSFYDLTAYYTAWFKTGVQPAINRDVLYYFHRKHASTATPSTLQTHAYVRSAGSDPASDFIELLAFSTAPCTLRITIAGQATEQDVGAGLVSLRVALAEGTPTFELLRNGTSVASVASGYPISNSITYQDMLYRSGSSLRPLVAPR